MDKRKKRTSINQYLMYIELLEKDPIFHSGIAPCDAEPNYLNNKWKDLSARLNTCPNGPQLSPEEWKKRLNDWKSHTRHKYRRSISGEKDIAMSPLEVRALILFASTPQALAIASVESTRNIPPAVTPDEPPPIVEVEPPIEAQPAPAEQPPQINFDTSALELQLKRIADIKAAKLRFEIAKYKFNNPGFEYSTDVL